MSVSTSICLSGHNRHTRCSPSLWVPSLLDWILMDVSYASCCCFFLCSVFIMSPVSTTLTMTTHSSNDSCMLQYIISPFSGYPGSLLNGASSNIRSAWFGSATTADTKALWRCCWPCHCTTAEPSILNASSGPCQLCHRSSTGRFLFQSWASHCLVYYMFGVCSGVCFLLSGAMLDAIFTLGAQPLGFAPLQPFGAFSWQTYVQPGNGHWPSTTFSRGSLRCGDWVSGWWVYLDMVYRVVCCSFPH